MPGKKEFLSICCKARVGSERADVVQLVACWTAGSKTLRASGRYYVGVSFIKKSLH